MDHWMRAWLTFWAMVRVQMLILSRYPVNLAAGLAANLGQVLVLALAVRLFSQGEQTRILTGAMFYGYLLHAFLTESLWRIGFSIREEQVQGTLDALYLAPVGKFANLLARIVPLLCLAAAGVGLGLGAAVAVFGPLPASNMPLAAAIFVLTLSGAFGLGFCFAALTLTIGDGAASIGNFLEFGLILVCAMFFPFRVLPEPVRWLSRLVPFSYCVDAFRSALLGFPPGFPELAAIETEVVLVAAFGVLSPLAGYVLYLAAERRLRSKGRLGLY